LGPMSRVLVVDDDATVAEVLTRYLTRDGFEVAVAGDGLTALRLAATEWPALVILDLMLPGLDGLEVCRRLRDLGPVPVIMLTAKGDEEDRIVGLELGADDYVAKPFSPRELVARVKAVLRRSSADGGDPSLSERLSAGPVVVDMRARAAWNGGVALTLTGRELELLAFLMAHPNRAFTREELLENVWGYTYGDTSTVTVHVRRLREKVEADPADPVYIQTVWGVGYRFAVPSVDSIGAS
jgi:two-component system response regulator ResD